MENTYRSLLRVLKLLAAVLLAAVSASANPASGGYQLFEPVASEHQAGIRLASLGNFAPSPETASESSLAPSRTLVDPSEVGGIAGVRPHPDGPAAGGRKPQFQADGGIDQARIDFETSVGGDYTTLANGNLRGTGPNGENMIFNPQSSGGLNPDVAGPPTIYVNGSAIRYD